MQRAFNELALCVKAKIMHRRRTGRALPLPSPPCTDGTANSNANIITFINTSAFVLRNNKHREEDDSLARQLATVVRQEQEQQEEGKEQQQEQLSCLTTWQICPVSTVDSGVRLRDVLMSKNGQYGWLIYMYVCRAWERRENAAKHTYKSISP